MIIPANAKAIIESIRTEHRYSLKEIAQAIGVSPKVLYCILNDQPYSPNTDAKLMLFYIQIKVIAILKKERGLKENITRRKILTIQENKDEILKLQRAIYKNKYSHKNLTAKCNIQNNLSPYSCCRSI